MAGCVSFSGYWDKSVKFVRERKFSEAYSAMESEIAKKPRDATIRFRYSLILHAGGRFTEAAAQSDTSFIFGMKESDAFKEAEKFGVSLGDIYAEAGFQYLEKLLYSDAAGCFLKAASLSLETPYFYNLAGFSMLKADDETQAALYFSKALEIDSLYEEARLNYSLSLFRAGDYSLLLSFLKKYRTLKPSEYYMLGTAMLLSLDSFSVIENKDEIQSYFDMALEDTSSVIKASALYNNAMLGVMSGDRENALKCFSEASVLDSTSFSLYYNYGVLLMESGLYNQAKNILTIAIALDPYFADAYTNRAICCEKLGERDNAKLDYIRGMELRKEQ